MLKQMTADGLNSLKGAIFSFGPSKNENKKVINSKIIGIFPLVLKLCTVESLLRPQVEPAKKMRP